jgi:hypothetical protein
MIKKLNLKMAGIISIAVAGLTIIVHLLVIFQVMPYTWINGGRSVSYEAACQTSISSIVILLIGMPINLIASKIIPIKLNKFWAVILTVILWLGVPFTCAGVILQLLGSMFEKCCMSIINFLAAVVSIRIALEKRW